MGFGGGYLILNRTDALLAQNSGQSLTCQELDSSAKKDILEHVLMSGVQSVGTWLQYCGWKERATALVGCRTRSQQANMSAAQTPPGGGAAVAA